ncbi:MAG: hypothetical protein MUP98_14115 [Candidatus Aminicenantes bacterium]|nr:hypothetical protein [Candidatus Aminicenantes bacterium]
MNCRNTKPHRKGWILLLIVFSLPAVGISQEFSADDAPGLLSTIHTESPGLLSCMKCHNEDFEVVPKLCLTCHQEIARGITNQRGYHKDFGEDCVMCHTEHGGEETVLIEWVPADFDHEEIGIKLEGSHLSVSDCRDCHRSDNTIPRLKTQSYIFIKYGCEACHSSPHPGRQSECLACHTQKNWRVEIKDKLDL